MADLFDRAQEVDAMFRQMAIDKATSKTTLPSALICEECGEDIPEKRRLAVKGCRYCVGCLEEMERKGR